MATNNSNVVREGIAAGLIGASAIAIWFAIVDLMAGQIGLTPITLGTSIGSLFLGADDPPSRAAAFIGYTIFHFGVFMAIGILLAWIVNRAEKVPSVFIGFLILFVAFEVGWIGWTTVLSQGFGQITWLNVFIANLVGAAAMGWYLWRQHPALPKRVGRVLAGAPE